MKSHIYPEFFYEAIYSSEKHRFLAVPLEDSRRMQLHQKGLREKMLCSECEAKFAEWEDYSSKLLRGQQSLDFEQRRDRTIVHGVQYAPFKLFHMSLIWRAGVATSPDFSGVSLGPHANWLKRLLVDDNPGEEGDYPCMFVVVPDPLGISWQAMMLPLAFRVGRHRAYYSLAGGLLWIFLVCRTAASYQHRDCFLSRQGDLTLLKGNMSLAHKMIINMKQHVKKARSRPDSHRLKDWGYD